MITLLAVACSEQRLNAVGTGGGSVPSQPLTCQEGPWDDRAVPVAEECAAAAADWNLVERWHFVEPTLAAVTVQSGRFSDSDGDGRITRADAISLWATPGTFADGAAGMFLLDAEGNVSQLDDSYANTYRTYSRVADIDPSRLGMEVGVSSTVWRGGAYWSIGDETSRYLNAKFGAEGEGVPWFVDLDADGTLEVLVGSAVLDAQSGALLRVLAGADTHNTRTIAEDLDVDGMPEIIALMKTGGVGIWPGTGGDPVVCPIGQSEATFAVGDLDLDGIAEVIVHTDGALGICGADGVLRASRAGPDLGSEPVGIGELDGDPEPEIVAGQSGNTAGITAYDQQLDVLWAVDDDTAGFNPFTLADLDGDGRHEIIYRDDKWLKILDGNGQELAAIEAGRTSNQSLNVPLVVDIDGDDLAEIVVAGDNPAVQVFENASGGWPVADADLPAPGLDVHPGILPVDGRVPTQPDAFWTSPARNVWQGHPSGPPETPDLSVEAVSACADSCTSAGIVTLYVTNHGPGDLVEAAEVELRRVEDDVLIGSVSLPSPLLAGNGRAVTITIPPSEWAADVRATVDPRGRVYECSSTDAVNSTVFSIACR